RPERDRPHLRLPALQPPRDLPVRPRLPARLPRGRGRADGAPPPPQHARGARPDVQARRRAVVDRLWQVRLLHDQGAACDLRRPGAGAAGRGARRRGADRGDARDLMELRIQLVAIGGTFVLLLIVLELVRRRRLLERYALVWLASALILLAL